MDQTLSGRLQGRESGIVLARLEMKVRGEVVQRAVNHAASLVLDDGEEVALDASKLAAVHPPIKRGGRWDELADSPIGKLFADRAPGDHVEVAITGWMIESGERVVVRGTRSNNAKVGALPTAAEKVSGARAYEVDERLRARRADPSKLQPESDGSREPIGGTTGSGLIVRRIAVVDPVGGDASAIRVLDEAERVRTEDPKPPKPPAPERPPRPPKPWRIMAPVFLVIAIVLALQGVRMWRDPLAALASLRSVDGLGWLEGAAIALMAALAMWLSRPPFEAHDSGTQTKVFHPSWAIGKALLFAVLLPALAIPLGGAFSMFTVRSLLVIPLYAIAASTLALFLWCVIRNRRTIRLARLLLFGPNRITGTVRGEAKVAERVIDYTRRSQTQTRTVTDANGHPTLQTSTSHWVEGSSGGSFVRDFQIVTKDRTVDVACKRAFWGAPHLYTGGGKGSSRACSTRATVGNGDSIIARGRIGDDGVIHAGGAEAFIMFGAPEDARGTLLVLTLNWLANAAALLGIAVASFVYALML